MAYQVLEHSYYARPQDPDDKEKIVRGVLSLSPAVAPYKAIIMPLDQRVRALLNCPFTSVLPSRSPS
eukprot:760349-Hanusia_phi.AAC.1